LNTSVAIFDSNLAIYTIVITEHTSQAFGLVEQLKKRKVSLYAPRLWIYEVISGINKYRHVQQISSKEAEKAVETAYRLGVNLIDETPDLCRAALYWAGQLGQMAAYDGFYLASAEKLDAPLWTGDQRLANAAHQAGISWVHWMGDQNVNG